MMLDRRAMNAAACEGRGFRTYKRKHHKMNQHDKDNLRFLLSASPETLKDWYDKVGSEDHEYAMELIHTYKAELIVAELESSDNVEDLTEANKILARFTL
jgi:hypothetical protein